MPYILETIKSVQDQTYQNIEYIVIDGKSTDGTINCIKSNQSKIDYFVTESDNGIADAFNKGLASASGNYIMFLNADDKLASSNSIRILVDEALKNKQPTFVYGDCDVVDRETACFIYRASVDFDFKNIKRGEMPPHPSMIVNKSYFDKYGNFDTNFKIAMDFEWFIRGVRISKVIHCPQLITYVRDGGISTKTQMKVIAEITKALMKHRFVESMFHTFLIKLYFISRYLLRLLLMKLGLFEAIRKMFISR
jgi:glycosyltransferase